MDWDLLFSYVLRCLPAILIGLLFLALVPKNRTEIRIFAYIFIFVILRDTMTPLWLWRLGSEGWFWLRVTELPVLMLLVAVSSVGIVLATNAYEPELRRLIVWLKGPLITALLAALVGAAFVAAPVVLLYQTVPIAQRGGTVPLEVLPILLIFCVLVNLYEESLFRGYFQGYIEPYTSPVRAAVLSGVLFAFGHTFLATTVTNVGAPLILFTLYEGVIAGLVRMRYGLIASTLTHGVGIFLLCSGIF